jgi:GTP-binding protein
MLIDDVTISVAAGNGGDGTVAFNKNLKELGPTGATGGNGGSVSCHGVADIGALSRFRNTKEANAGDGKKGGVQYRDGEDGADIDFPVPIGTVIHNLDTGTDIEVSAVGQHILLAKGGKGGKGNYHFRSSTDTSPRKFDRGTSGEHFTIRLELKLIADVGLIGLPNAGKSSLMNELTRAQQKVANYPFTTLEPGLGAYYELVLADIPGLIEGASSGKGLGTKFLRHIERTRTLFHLVSCESADPVADYYAIRNELTRHNPLLAEKQEHVFLTKTDLVDADAVREKMDALSKKGITATPLSIHDSDALARVAAILRDIIAAKKASVS